MIEIKQHSGIYTLTTKQFIPYSIDRVWEFFSMPANLKKITPEHMKFDITSNDFRTAFPGQIITYKIGILPGIKSNWVTEISQVEKLKYFIDEQRFGPYTMWHHEHRFEESEGGTIMHDRISYKIPLGILGKMVHHLFIRQQLMKIFVFRKLAVEKLEF